MNIVFFASALSYFVTKTSASYVSRSELIQAYLRQEQRTSIRKVPFDQKFHHFLIVLRRWASATTNARTARTYTVCKITTTIILCVCLECTTCIFVFYVVIFRHEVFLCKIGFLSVQNLYQNLYILYTSKSLVRIWGVYKMIGQSISLLNQYLESWPLN